MGVSDNNDFLFKNISRSSKGVVVDKDNNIDETIFSNDCDNLMNIVNLT